MHRILLPLLALAFPLAAPAQLPDAIDPSQKNWYERYKKQENAPDPAKQAFNDDPEPALDGEGWAALFNGKDLDGWVARGGTCKFEVEDGEIVGTTVKGSASTYLSTKRSDFRDFVFTCEVKWIVDSNTGIQFRSKVKEEKGKEVVFGPQAELEGSGRGRGWSGGIYGQSCGGYWYPVWLADERHKKARAAFQKDEWNRITIKAKGTRLQTWLNGVPIGQIENEEYDAGFFALQVHSGKEGVVRFRDLRVKELE